MITAITPITTSAQTQYKARVGSVAVGDQITPSIAKPAQDGFTVIVWQDNRGADDANIYAQMLDNVNGLPQWYPPDGVPVCTALGLQRNPVASYDSSGGVIICWEDFRNRIGAPIVDSTTSEIYAQRLLLADGSQDGTWNSAGAGYGTPVCAGTNAISRDVRIAGTINGAFFCWTDYRNSSGYPNYYNKEVFLQYLLTASASWPGGGNWTSNGINVPSNTNADQTAPAITLDHVRQWGQYGVYLAFEDMLTGTREIRVARIDPVGQSMWENLAAPGSEQRSPRIASTGSFTLEPLYGAAIAWEDARDLALNGWDVYAQRVDETGTMLWGQGVDVCTATEDQGNIALAARGDVCGLAWEDSRNAITTGLDAYGNVLDMISGIIHYTPSSIAAELSTDPNDQKNPDVDITLDGDWITMCWEDQRGYPGNPSDIYAESFWAGNPQTRRWGVGGKPVSSAKQAQVLPHIANNVVAWQDARREAINHDNTADENVYAQLLGDECDDPTDMHWRNVYIKHHQGADVEHFNFAIDSVGHRYVVWQESRPELGGEPAVFAQKLDIDGVPRWENGGVLISDSGTVAEMPDVCVDDNGGAFICWRQDGDQIKLGRITASGQPQGYADVGTGTEPHVVEDDQYGVYIGYLDGIIGPIFVRYNPWPGILGVPKTLPAPGYPSAVNLKMEKNREGAIWFAFHDLSNGEIIAGWTDCVLIKDKKLSIGGITAFSPEFDIVADVMPAHAFDVSGVTTYKTAGTASLYDLMIAVIEPIAPAVHVVRCWQDNAGTLDLDGPTDVSESANPATAFHSPTISVDSFAQRPFGNAGEQGGAIVAWAREYPDPVTTAPRHDVETQRVWWGAVLDLNATGTTKWGNTPLSLDQELTFIPSIDIAAFHGDQLHGPASGLVVWETDQALSCVGGYVALGAHLVKYTNSLPWADPRLWGVNGRALSPGIGNSRQIKPMLKMPFPCPVPYPVPVLWLDDRTGPTCLLGSSVVDRYENNTHYLDWRKESGKENMPVQGPTVMDMIAPHPVSLSARQQVSVRLNSVHGPVALFLTDLAGRQVAELYRGDLSGRESTVTFTPSASLAPGVYLLELRGERVHEIRSIVLTR